MSKLEHDAVAARDFRAVNYQKEWYGHGLSLLRQLKLPSGFSILDFGCGNGEFSELVRNEFPADVHCLDYAASHLDRVRNLGFKTIECNLDANEDVQRVMRDFREKFDVIISLEVIEHIFDVDTYLALAHALLKDDGLLIVSTPNMAYISHRLYSLYCGNVPVGDGHHVRFFDSRRLAQVVTLNGFDVVSQHNFGRGEFFLDRAMGENVHSPAALFVKMHFTLRRLFTLRSSESYYSELLFLAKKSARKPLGLDPPVRNARYGQMTLSEKKCLIAHLQMLRQKRFFDEHPGLREFIDKEVATGCAPEVSR